MKILPFLKEERINLNLQSTTKEEAIKEVASLLKDAPEIISFDNFIKDILKEKK